MTNLSQSPKQLQDVFSRLQSQWETTASQWNDASRQRFEREFIEGYEEVIHTTMKQMDKLAQILARASKELR
jgi:hypothetical protein